MIYYVCDICDKKIKGEDPVEVTVNYSKLFNPINKHMCSRCWQKVSDFIDDMKDGVIIDLS